MRVYTHTHTRFNGKYTFVGVSIKHSPRRYVNASRWPFIFVRSFAFVQYMMFNTIYYLCASKRAESVNIAFALHSSTPSSPVLLVVRKSHTTNAPAAHELQRRHNSEVELRNILAPIKTTALPLDSPNDCWRLHNTSAGIP